MEQDTDPVHGAATPSESEHTAHQQDDRESILRA
jgi:hypothetical protein